MQNQIPKSKIDNTELNITKIGLGCASIGNLYTPISTEQAFQVINASIQKGITYFDTAPWYGTGLSEQRLGLALHNANIEYQISTKVGRFLIPDEEFEKDLIMQKIWQQRAPYKPNCHKDQIDFYYKQLFEGQNAGIEALKQLKKEKKIKAFGGSINGNNDKKYIEKYINDLLKNDADFLMISGTPTLLDQGFLEIPNFFDINIIVAAPYCSGILAGKQKTIFIKIK
ncbi:hypothetical protein IMG5_194940 [Ichthyophthirius multifiliis]|uniref:NADP-dependent oxidoreductase domain-containing protein n=1 Tax=Ichthyophthirius multifiliis TaxID=5932 RepID=G0R4U8_ICHMU|nr:hypothetical protein IMG5_194940 [Ichthyophthirius multifiliis]EGR27491.1 hypothetical protein IMG5_194940 [Ichthyophthirius multifiliis]|eukprot:XP_004024401.1 hypothetical protein IMG5_194940 [Ichthyophthirius multifiliis]